ncbi:hypothetical protein AX14_007726 [Amanita brunnescens Koide BX004]|nr:hypothetical protein AX14_007726 [Amanita brunnescens Koide BX004]
MSLTFGVNLDSTLGPLFVGFSFSCIIFGFLSMQAFTYYQRFPNDLHAYKTLVVSLWLLELFDQIVIGHAAYTYVISDFGNLLAIITRKVVWSLIVQVLIGSFVGMIVKTCFAMRVWRFSGHNMVITGTILILVATTFALAVAYTVKTIALTSILEVDTIKIYGTAALATGVATDAFTASALCYFLHKMRTGHKTSDSLINTLTIYAINTGVLTSAISLTTLLLYNLQQHAFYFMATYFCLGKVYAISLLCTLNTRKTVRGRGTDHGGNTNSNAGKRSTFFLVTHHLRSSRIQEQQTTSLQIDVKEEVSVTTDARSPSEYTNTTLESVQEV